MTDIDQPVVLQNREVLGKGLNKLRTDGLVPGVIHNHGAESIHVALPAGELTRVYREAGKHHPLNLTIDQQKFLALIKDVHYNPVKRQPEHVVFQAIRQDEKVEAEVPVRLDGEIPAEKVGLMVLHQLDAVQIEALPKDLPDELTVDATQLAELHDKLTVSDIKAPSGVTILTDAEHPIATVVETKAMMSEEAETEGEEAAEGEGETGNAEDGANPPAGGEAAGQESPKE
jgi:large subunit ribosomal protein L25